jgi:hypothetical protein
MHCLSEIEMKRNMIFLIAGTSYFIVVGRAYQQQKMQTITWQKTQLKNVKSLVLCVEYKVLFSITGQWALASKLMPLASEYRHVAFQ